MNRLVAVLSILVIWISDSVVAQERLSLLGAIEKSMEQDAQIRLQRTDLQLSTANWLSTKGDFDFVLSGNLEYLRDHRVLTPLEQSQNNNLSRIPLDNTSYQLSLSKKFDWGMVVRSGLRMNRWDYHISGYPTVNSATAFISFTIPVLRGRGVGSSGREFAASLTAEASRLEVLFTTSQRVRDAAAAYWAYVAAAKNLDIALDAEQRAMALVKEIKTLITYDELPAAELQHIEAFAADKRIQRITAEQRLLESKHNLGLIMGLSVTQIESLHLPGDSFPDTSDAVPHLEDVALLSARALEDRSDQRALLLRREGASALLENATNNALSRFDIVVDLGYNGYENGNTLREYFSPFSNNIPGLNASATVKVELPIQNNTGSGATLQSVASLERSDIEADDNERRINSRVRTSLSDLHRAIALLQNANEAVKLYEIAIQNEEKKRRLGQSTLIDVLSVQDRLTSAQYNVIASQQKYANAVVTLRFETGSLVRSDGGRYSVGIDELTRPPLLGEPK